MHIASSIESASGPRLRAVLSALGERRRRTRVDRDIADSVFEAFEAAGRPDVEGLHFYVFEGAISIYGAVSTHADRNAVLATLSGIGGIAHIADHMTVLG